LLAAGRRGWLLVPLRGHGHSVIALTFLMATT